MARASGKRRDVAGDFDIDEHWERFDAAMADERLVDGTATVRTIEERDGDDPDLAYFVLDVDVATPGGGSAEATMPFHGVSTSMARFAFHTDGNSKSSLIALTLRTPVPPAGTFWLRPSGLKGTNAGLVLFW